MKGMRKIVGAIVVLMWLGSSLTAPAHAGPPIPLTPPAPPRAPVQPPVQVEMATTPPLQTLGTTPLKAVLIVGSIDGASGSWTTREKANMDLAAQELQANGVTVYKFYAPNDNWDQIKAAAQGAHFLFYRGHGIYWSDMPTPTVGGFALSNGVFISSDQIRSDLHLAANAIVMLFGCFTAGTANDTLDPTPISSAEAQRRVAQYSDPFFDIGVGGYYANWLDDAFQMFVRYLFQGMTLGEAYQAYNNSTNHSAVEIHSHPDHPEMAMHLGTNPWSASGGTVYNNAFVGSPDRALADLFPLVATTPSTLSYLAEPSYPAGSFTIHLDSFNTFSWTATVIADDPSWISIPSPSGSSGQGVTVVLTPTGKAPGTYQASIRIVVDSPVFGQQILTVPVSIIVVNEIQGVNMPAFFR